MQNQNQGNSQNNQQGTQNKQTLSWSTPSGSTQPNQPSKPTPGQAKPILLSEATTSTQGGAGRVFGITVGAVAVLALLAWGAISLRHRSEQAGVVTDTSDTAPTDASDTTPTTPAGGANTATSPAEAPVASALTFTVPTPQDAGSTVAVSGVVVDKPTWVVVSEDAGGVPGTVLGAGLFWAGHSDGDVPLLRATKAGASYLVTEAPDNGNRTYDLHVDAPLQSPSGVVLAVPFTAK